MDDMQILEDALTPELSGSAPDHLSEGDLEGSEVQDETDSPASEAEILEVTSEETSSPAGAEPPEVSAPGDAPVIVISGDAFSEGEDVGADYFSDKKEVREEYRDSGPVLVVQEPPPRPLFTTPFSDYTVTEGLLLLLLLCLVAQSCIRMLKGGFSWLR